MSGAIPPFPHTFLCLDAKLRNGITLSTRQDTQREFSV
jgi:hypothetical protein